MSFFSDNKLLFAAAGIALSSAALGYILSRVSQRSDASAWGNFNIKVNRQLTPLARYVMNYGIREPLPLKQLRQATLDHPERGMLVSADEAQFMRLLIQLIGAKKVMEVGVFTGFNTLSMAIALPPDGKVVACDITDKYMKELQSQKYFEEAGVESKIDLRLQPAVKTMDDLLAAGEAGTFDLVFIDANKTGYDQYYEKSLGLLRKGGLIVLDNVLWSSKVCDPQERKNDEEVNALHSLNVKVQQDQRVVMCLMPFADGVTVAMKL